MTGTHSPGWKWWVCGALFLATMLNYMDRQALPQTATTLKAEYHLGDARYGWLAASFGWAFACGGLFFGTIADRFGPRRVYPIVLLGWSLAGLLTPLLIFPSVTQPLEDPESPGSGAFHWLLGCRTMLGFFEAGHWPCALLTARQIFTSRDRPMGNGLLQSGATIGTVVVIGFVYLARQFTLDWPVIFWTVGAIGLLWLPLWLFLVRPGDLDGPPPPPAADAGERRSTAAQVRMLLTLALVVASLAVSWQLLREWLPKYLVESQGFSRDFRDAAVIAFNLFADVGSLMSGVIVYRLTRLGAGVHGARVAGFALFTLVTAAAALVPIVGGGLPGVLCLILAGAGILGLHPYYYALVQEVSTRRMGTFSGMMSACAWGTSAIVQAFFGKHVEETGSYDAGFVLVGFAPLVGLTALLILWRPSRTVNG